MRGGERMNMNVVFFQQTPQLGQQGPMQSTQAISVPFRQLVNQTTNETPMVENTIDVKESTETSVRRLMNWLEQLSEEDLDALINWFETEFNVEVNHLQQLVNGLTALDVSHIDQENELIEELVRVLALEDDQKDEESQANIVVNQNAIVAIHEYITIDQSGKQLNNRAISESIDQVIAHFEDFSQSDAKQLLDLLKQMQATNEPLATIFENTTLQENDQSKLNVFEKVYENFIKKTTLADQTTYRSNTMVTSKDVLKWVRAALEQTSLTKGETANTFGQMFSQQRTDTTVEQLQIQLGQSVDTTEQVNEQLLSQFEKAISQSRFIQNLSGNNQLLLKLAPKSLGTIMVELTEIDGEMLVKLTASTQTAKEALEANVRELRHMFAPHNIVIEKQDAEPIFVEQPSPYEDMPDEQESHQQNQQSRQTEQIDYDDEAIRFEDLLYQERVE